MTTPSCPTFLIGAQGLRIRMPGGATLQTMPIVEIPTGFNVVKDLLGQINAGLAPLTPVFNIIDAILAIQGFVEAMTDALGPPPDPTVLAGAIEDVIAKVAKLAELVPQLSVPFMVLDMIDTAIVTLNAIIGQLEVVIFQELRIAAALTKATESGNDALLEIALCAEGINLQVKNGISEGFGPLNSFFGVLNLFLGLIGAPEVPQLDDLGDDAAEVIQSLKDFVKILEDIRGAIPIP